MTQWDINMRSANIPAVQARPIYPSEIDAFRRCPRKWAFRYLARSPRQPQSPSQILGDQTHELFDAWIKVGQPPLPERSLADDLLVAALPYLPAPRSGQSEADAKVEIEAPGQGNSIGAIRYGVRRDWFGRTEQVRNFAELEMFGDAPLVVDLKTASNPLKYGLWSRDAFLADTEAVLYMLGLIAPQPRAEAVANGQALAFPVDPSIQRILTGQEIANGPDVVGARWVYMQTPKKDEAGEFKWTPGKPFRAFPSDVILGRDSLNRAHLRIIAPVARNIIELREQSTCGGGVQPLNLPFNLDACNDFFRLCGYADKCNGHFPTEVLVSAGYKQTFEKGEDTMTQQNFMSDFAPVPGAGQAPALAAQQAAPAPAWNPPPLPQQQTAPAQISQAAPAWNPPAAQAAPAWNPPPMAAAPAPYQARVNPPENPYAPAPAMPAAPAPAPTAPTIGLNEAIAACETLLRFLASR